VEVLVRIFLGVLLSTVSQLTVDRRTFLTALAGTPRACTAGEEHARERYR